MKKILSEIKDLKTDMSIVLIIDALCQTAKDLIEVLATMSVIYMYWVMVVGIPDMDFSVITAIILVVVFIIFDIRLMININKYVDRWLVVWLTVLPIGGLIVFTICLFWG